jgi:hypothetical protein
MLGELSTIIEGYGFPLRLKQAAESLSDHLTYFSRYFCLQLGAEDKPCLLLSNLPRWVQKESDHPPNGQTHYLTVYERLWIKRLASIGTQRQLKSHHYKLALGQSKNQQSVSDIICGR